MFLELVKLRKGLLTVVDVASINVWTKMSSKVFDEIVTLCVCFGTVLAGVRAEAGVCKQVTLQVTCTSESHAAEIAVELFLWNLKLD